MTEKRSRDKDERTKRAGHPAEEEFEQRIIDLARVTRVMAGGKRMRFRACVALGDRKGRVGMGIAKGADVTVAVNKAATKAKKSMILVAFVNDTIRHEVKMKYKAARILMRPAQGGRGIVAGGSMRQILELCGVNNIVCKILGSNNKINNAMATLAALGKLRKTASQQREDKMPDATEQKEMTERKEHVAT